MELHELVRALLTGDLLSARQYVADARRGNVDWSRLSPPSGYTEREMAVAAAIVELLATRNGSAPPPWTHAVGGLHEALILDPGLDRMPRSFARAKAAGPEPLRRRNLIALPDFLDVA
jgi:hypothetical protein